jgi:hypothetical protein
MRRSDYHDVLYLKEDHIEFIKKFFSPAMVSETVKKQRNDDAKLLWLVQNVDKKISLVANSALNVFNKCEIAA